MNDSGSKSVFLLGGGLMQLPAIEAAGELGFVRHLADGNAQCRGKDKVEHFYHVDLRDIDGLLATARSIPNLTGVFTAGTDFSRSVAYVAESCGLPGISYDTAMKATDKGLMRETLHHQGVAVPRFVVYDGNDIVGEGELGDLPFPPPYVVKPVDNMGARGVIRVHEYYELRRAVEAARLLSASGRVIVEELIDGKEYSIDALIADGEVTITGIGERHIFFPPYFVELGHTIPAPLEPAERNALEHGFTRAINAIGIENGAAKGDVFLTGPFNGEYGTVIGEIAARLSGGFMSGWTYPYATGIPLTTLALRIATGDTPSTADFTPKAQLVSAERALISAPGTITAIEVPKIHDPRIREVFVHNVVGDTVKPPENNVQKVANVIAVAPDANEAHAAAIEALDRIGVVLKPDVPETSDFVCDRGWRSRYSQYRVVNDTLAATLSAGGSFSTLDELIDHESAEDIPLRVQPVNRLSGSLEDIVVNHVGISPEILLRRIEQEGIVRFDTAASTAASIVFWRSFIAAGRQGVRYLHNTIDTRRRRREAVL